MIKTSLVPTLNKDDVEHAYLIAAKVVAKFGDVYLPIFERLHNELQKYNESSAIKSLALAVASGVYFNGNKE